MFDRATHHPQATVPCSSVKPLVGTPKARGNIRDLEARRRRPAISSSQVGATGRTYWVLLSAPGRRRQPLSVDGGRSDRASDTSRSVCP
jgi:hypothetical protein